MISFDLLENTSQYSEKNIGDYISNLMKKVEGLSDLSDMESLARIYSKLNEWNSRNDEKKDFILDELCKNRFLPITSDILNNLKGNEYVTDRSLGYVTTFILICLCNFSDSNQEFVVKMLQSPLPDLIISYVTEDHYKSNLHESATYEFVNMSLNVIHNMVCFPDTKGLLLNTSELKNSLCDLIMRDQSDSIGLTSMLILACLINENETHLLEKGKNTIKVLIDCTKMAFDDQSKTCYGISLWELINAIRGISVNDNMKKIIVKENGIPVIIDILKATTLEIEMENCLGVLWNLCFDKIIKRSLLRHYDLRAVIEPFENHSSVKIKKIIDGISWLIDKKSLFKQNIKSILLFSKDLLEKKWKFDVFLSYSWINQSTIVSINEELKRHDIKAWIDLKEMSGSTVEAMADGIEKSMIFIMGVSEAYETSCDCRTEAEYAYSLRKPIIPIVLQVKYRPKGWLGLIKGNKIHYEFSERRNFNQSFSGLLDNIKKIMYPKDPEFEKLSILNTQQTPQSGSISQVVNWSCKDVEKWLIEKDLGKYLEQFADIDGKSLGSMVDLYSKCPDYLLMNVREEFKMQFKDVLKFNLAIQELK